MKIIIITINYNPEITGIGKYTTELAEWLGKKGHKVKVITAIPYYPEWKIKNGFKQKYYKTIENQVTIYRCPLYIPEHPSILKRLLYLFSFFITSLPVTLLQICWKPDIVLITEPPFFCVPSALFVAWVCKAKTWLHIMDLEFDILHKTARKKIGPVQSKLKKIEQFFNGKFDRISTISDMMRSKVVQNNFCSSKTFLFPNWVDTESVSPENVLVDFKKEWNINKDTFTILYSGTIGKKQGIEIVVDVAERFKNDKEVLFVIVGDGVGKKKLVNLVEKKQLQNIVFKPFQTAEMLPSLLNSVDLHLIIQKKSFADLVLPSKLITILSVGGISVLTAEPETELGKLVLSNQDTAILCEPENPEALYRCIQDIKINKNLQERIKVAARKYALENFDKEHVLEKFEREALRIVK